MNWQKLEVVEGLRAMTRRDSLSVADLEIDHSCWMWEFFVAEAVSGDVEGTKSRRRLRQAPVGIERMSQTRQSDGMLGSIIRVGGDVAWRQSSSLYRDVSLRGSFRRREFLWVKTMACR